MDELFKLLALLVIMAFTGLSTLSKKAREKQKEMESNLPDSYPQQPWEPKKAEPKTFTPPVKKPVLQPSHRPNQAKPVLQPAQQPVSQPATALEEPLWSKMLREVLDMNQPVPEPVFEPAPPPVEPPKKLIRRKREESPQKEARGTKPSQPPKQPVPPLRKTAALTSLPNPLAAILEGAKNEPLRAAILLSEIVQPPRAKRRRIRAM